MSCLEYSLSENRIRQFARGESRFCENPSRQHISLNADSSSVYVFYCITDLVKGPASASPTNTNQIADLLAFPMCVPTK